MAGKRQHFIPQFLQKGFASHAVGNEVFTWVFRKGIKPFNPNIKNVGVEGYFYSESDDQKLDEAITEREKSFSVIVSSLRSGKPIESINVELLIQLIAHLEVRTRHIRQSFLTTGDHILNEFLRFFEDTNASEEFLLRKVKQNPSLISDLMAEELRKLEIPQAMLPQFIQLLGPKIKEVLPNYMSIMAEHLRTIIPSTLKQATKSGHIKALNQTLTPELKVTRYRNLSFKLLVIEEPSLLLGDSGVLFHTESERPFKPFLEKDDFLKAVFLPIHSQKVIVGSNRNYSVNLSDLPIEIARCSLEYFIASDATKTNADLSESIGENASLLSNHQIETMMDELINE